MKLEWKKRNFDRHEVMQLELVDAYNESRIIASIVTLQPNTNEEKMLDLRYTLYFEEWKRPFCLIRSMEEAKRTALQFIKEEAVERIKELTYIINFIERCE